MELKDVMDFDFNSIRNSVSEVPQTNKRPRQGSMISHGSIENELPDFGANFYESAMVILNNNSASKEAESNHNMTPLNPLKDFGYHT